MCTTADNSIEKLGKNEIDIKKEARLQYFRNYNKIYYKKHHDKFIEKKKCECGGVYTYLNYTKHLKAKKHIAYEKYIEELNKLKQQQPQEQFYQIVCA